MGRKIYYVVAIWSLYAVVMTALMYFVHPPYLQNYSILDELKWEFSFSIAGITATPIITTFSRRYSLLNNKKFKNGIALFIFGIFLSLLLCIEHALAVFVLHGGTRPLDQSLLMTSLFYNIDQFIVTYFVIVALQHALMYYRQLQEKEVRESQLQTQLAQAQMQALKMQLQPHFLFNTLNAIITLIHKNPDLAEEMIVRLSDFLRLTLDASGKQLVSLKEELSFVKAYLDIEKVRFEEKFEYREQVSGDLLDAEVPLLMLQPLVENAIKHGISRYSSANLVEIEARKEGEKLVVIVKDNGMPLQNGEELQHSEKIGLTNTRSRLQTLYGSKSSLTIEPNSPRGFAVAVSFPFSSVRYDDEHTDS